MGMTFEEGLNNLIELQKDYQQFHDDVWQDPESYGIIAESLRIGIETMRKYQLMQADYEHRLKADMVAMLTELQLEVHELWDNDPSYIEGVHDSEMVIQHKINSLKEA